MDGKAPTKGSESKGKGKGKGKEQSKGWQKDGRWQQNSNWGGPKKDWRSKQKDKPDGKDGKNPKEEDNFLLRGAGSRGMGR